MFHLLNLKKTCLSSSLRIKVFKDYNEVKVIKTRYCFTSNLNKSALLRMSGLGGGGWGGTTCCRLDNLTGGQNIC
jgi:hypothetical protein